MNTVKICIKLNEWEQYGDYSLEGLISKATPEGTICTKVQIEVEQTSLFYREKHGPEVILVPEYTIPALMRSVQRLVEKGLIVSIVDKVLETINKGN